MTSSVISEIDRSYTRLMANVDNHIARLSAIEAQLNYELELMEDANVHAGYSTTESESDDDEDAYDPFYLEGLRDRLFDPNPDYNLDVPRVRWGNIREYANDDSSVRSDSTVLNNYTPYDIPDSDDESDSDTVVLEWDDPCRSPELRIMYREIDRPDI